MGKFLGRQARIAVCFSLKCARTIILIQLLSNWLSANEFRDTSCRSFPPTACRCLLAVPLLLAMGIGIMKFCNERGGSAPDLPNALQGFGEQRGDAMIRCAIEFNPYPAVWACFWRSRNLCVAASVGSISPSVCCRTATPFSTACLLLECNRCLLIDGSAFFNKAVDQIRLSFGPAVQCVNVRAGNVCC